MMIPETFFTVSEELKLFLISCIFGAAMGTVYDVIRAFRLILAHNGWLTALEDVFFLFLCGVELVAFSEIFARSEMRAYFAIGNAIGFTLYFVTIGSVIVGTLRKLFTLFNRAFSFVFSPFRAAFVILSEKVLVKFVGISKNIVKPVKKVKMGLINTQNVLYNKMENKKRKNVKNVVEKNEARKGKEEGSV